MAQIVEAEATADVAHRHDRHYHIIEGPENRDELRDEVDRREDPGEQPDQDQPDVEGRRPIGDHGPHESHHIRDDTEDLANGHAPGPERPEEDEEDHPQPDQGHGDPDECAGIHGNDHAIRVERGTIHA